MVRRGPERHAARHAIVGREKRADETSFSFLRELDRRVAVLELFHRTASDDDRLRWGFTECVSRPPSVKELQVLTAALARERSRYQADEKLARAYLAVGESPRDEAAVPAVTPPSIAASEAAQSAAELVSAKSSQSAIAETKTVETDVSEEGARKPDANDKTVADISRGAPDAKEDQARLPETEKPASTIFGLCSRATLRISS